MTARRQIRNLDLILAVASALLAAAPFFIVVFLRGGDMTYPAHPLADIFPMIAEADLKVLAADIAANGQVEPILLLEGQVLDGRNRQAACGLAGVEPIYSDFSGVDPSVSCCQRICIVAT
ncbi:hypothetical protein HGG76_10425 [Ochrobactrum tritici]|uniref:Uncharacterized protein n=1 Tax=Brucella tritici TaxID=94626 RepID=A0A7X6FQ51_9HYPH|nr:hypothetical protein [Brucella tritici]